MGEAFRDLGTICKRAANEQLRDRRQSRGVRFLRLVPDCATCTEDCRERRAPELAYEQLEIARDALRDAMAGGIKENSRSHDALMEISQLLLESVK